MVTHQPLGSRCACAERDPDVLAGEILRYLQSHRTASDTTEGIARWWIKRQRLEDTLDQVQRALDRLVAQALVIPRVSAAGRVQYHLPPPSPGAGESVEREN